MKKNNSIGLQTELFFHNDAGNLEDKGNYYVVRTEDNPGYYWGNFLAFKSRPQKNDFKVWKESFNNEFQNDNEAKHFAFTWAGLDNNEFTQEVSEFIKTNFEFDHTAILTSKHLKDPKVDTSKFVIKEINLKNEWVELVNLQIEINGGEDIDDEYRTFTQKKFEAYKKLITKGKGTWIGAFQNDTLIADLGIFLHCSMARFQNIETHPDYRSRGICRSLMYHASNWAKNVDPKSILVIEADLNDKPYSLYKLLGFSEKEYLFSLFKLKASSA